MAFTEDEAIRKLQELNNSQASVESTSQWFLNNIPFAKDLVKLWFKEFRKAHQKRKIAFLHLANDVIQNGISTAPQFGKLFEPVLPTAFKETSKIQKHSIRSAVAHLLIVWAARRVYSKSFLRQLRFICQCAVAESDAPDADEQTKRNIVAASPFAFSFTGVLINVNAPDRANSPGNVVRIPHSKTNRKRHHSSLEVDPSSMQSLDSDDNSHKKRDSISAFREELARELQTEAIPPPNISDLIQLLESLQSAASADASTRREIAQFPPEVSDADKAIDMIMNCSVTEREKIIEKIAGCAFKLDEYNKLLEEEAAKRNQLSLQLRAFHSNLKEKIDLAKSELEDLKSKLNHGSQLKNELVKHMSNLPDLRLLPDITSGLDPLPTVGDLFG